ncbi:hypothetical protein CASFOL_020827 [Castilleja foliolosa]|uniref:Uncharacterized protein n=1 Tax=Castilleja foliolosa TaxID=1961234 RepID=A0ABD3D5R3_9LAMI
MGRVYAIKNRIQYYKDKLKGQFRHRWISTFVLACFYVVRIYLNGYCIVTFYLSILISGFLRIFMSSVVCRDGSDLLPDPSDAPIKTSDHKFRPFVPLMPEFRFWCIVNMFFCVALSMTFIPKLNTHVSVVGIGSYFLFWLSFTFFQLIELLTSMKKDKFFPFYYGDKKQQGLKDETISQSDTESTARKVKGKAVSVEDWILTSSSPGGPYNPELIPSFGGHVAVDIWNHKERDTPRAHHRGGCIDAWPQLTGQTEDLVKKTGLYNLGMIHYANPDSSLIADR